MGSSRRLQKLRKKQWELVEDPLSVPKFETLQRKKEKEEREKRLQQIEQEYLEKWEKELNEIREKEGEEKIKELEARSQKLEKILFSFGKGDKVQDYLSLSDIVKGQFMERQDFKKLYEELDKLMKGKGTTTLKKFTSFKLIQRRLIQIIKL
jgi:hypothetical protein